MFFASGESDTLFLYWVSYRREQHLLFQADTRFVTVNVFLVLHLLLPQAPTKETGIAADGDVNPSFRIYY